MQGSQAGAAAANGAIPSASQPKGSPQCYTAAIGMLRSEVAALNKIQDVLFKDAGTDDHMHKAVKDVMGVTHKLQAITTTLEARLKQIIEERTPSPMG